ncbi:type II secretion system protein [Desulfonatronovibrio hydrogenovorans]|uniref:type II secretion system protein n=1 Tax=Desulfonatronovibrio hydrogenovorans TaxID=53245 RepID=UPI00068B7CDD|nr:type II secretion system protein [Desulfonatronovibrio hydrogenovorans]
MNRQSGFTLLEVLVVIGIMGFIAAMVAPRFGGLRDTASQTIRDSNQQRMTAAVASYWESNEVFPSGLVNLVYEDGTEDEYTAGRYIRPTHEGNLIHEGKVTFDQSFFTRLKPEVHILDSEEASALRRMGIMTLYNLNSYDYDGINESVVTPVGSAGREDRMRQAGRGITDNDPRIRAGLGVLMVGLGASTSATAASWSGQAATDANGTGIKTTGWTHPESIGRIILGLGPETELVKKDIISSAGLCPDGISNIRTAWNHYSLLLPRLQATVNRMNEATHSGGLAHLATITAKPENGPEREFNLLNAQPRYRFSVYSPAGLLGNDPENNLMWEIKDPD